MWVKVINSRFDKKTILSTNRRDEIYTFAL
jgi:hypothetical protein